MKKRILYIFLLAVSCMPTLFAQFMNSVALSVAGTEHTSSGEMVLVSYNTVITNVNASWDGSTFTAPRGGLYLATVSFTRDPYYQEGTYDDVYVYIYKNNTYCGFAWAPETNSVGRASGSYTVSLSLNEGDTIRTFAGSDGGYKRHIYHYFLTIVMIPATYY